MKEMVEKPFAKTAPSIEAFAFVAERLFADMPRHREYCEPEMSELKSNLSLI